MVPRELERQPEQSSIALSERSLRYLGGLRGEHLRIDQLGDQEKTAARQHLTAILENREGKSLSESLDHTQVQTISHQTREKAWQAKGVPEDQHVSQWVVDMALYVQQLPPSLQKILMQRLGIDAANQDMQKNLVEEFYIPYLNGGKADIAAFAKKFLAESDDIDTALSELQKIKGVLGAFVDGETLQERQQHMEDVETAIAAHMKALYGDRHPDNVQQLLDEVDKSFGIPDLTPPVVSVRRESPSAPLTESETDIPDSDETYAFALKTDIERVMNAPGNEKLKAAYESMRDKLGEPKVTRVPLVDGKAIRAETTKVSTEEGEQEVTDRVGNDFVMYEARQIDLGDPDRKSWKQGMSVNQTRTFHLDLFGLGGPKDYELAGLVGVVRGPNGSILINLTQEPAAAYLPKYAVFRTPLQTSATKIDAVLDGKTDLDPTISDVMKRLFPDKTLRELLASGDIHHFFPPDADGNRIISDNLGFELVISDTKQWEELLSSGKYYAANDNEVDMLASVKLVNGITASSNGASRGARLVRELYQSTS